MSSFQEWMQSLGAGDEDAATRLWRECFAGLVQKADQVLRPDQRRHTDEEDVALSALRSFVEARQRGEFNDLTDENELWALLSCITHRKAVNLVRFNQRNKRRGVGQSALNENSSAGFDQLAAANPGPELTVAVYETCQQRLAQLPVDLRRLALLKLANHSNRDIAIATGRSIATVERRLRRIRDIWSADMVFDG